MKAKDVKRAVVLAAGLGQRLRPLTLAHPKPLLPVDGVPMLERMVRMLEGWGVEEVAVNAHWLAPQIEKWAARRAGKAKIRVSVEREILGTGGALKALKDFIGEEPFWLANGDVVADGLKPGPIVEAFEKSGRFAGCWLSEGAGPRTVEADPEGRVCNWKSEFPGDWGTYTYCGVALLSPEVIGYLPEAKHCSVVEAYEKAMMTDARFVVGADQEDAFWADCGTFESYLETNAALNPDGFDRNPNVLLDGVKLLDTADLAGCAVTGGLIGGKFEETAIVGVAQTGDARLEALCKEMGWAREDAAAVFLGTRGSDRTFWRLVNGDERAIGVTWDGRTRPENGRYAGHARVLAEAGVAVPRVLADLPAMEALALEDCGDESLEKLAGAEGADRVKLYRPALEAMKALHGAGTELALARDLKLEAPFGPELYKWEHDLFETYCVKARYGYERLPEEVRKDLERAADELGKERPVLVHRDFQSSNVLCRGDGTVALIDFQGMRLGPASYDAASLLYDPYVALEEGEREKLAKLYPQKNLAYAAVQRLAQALGAFGRLEEAGQPQFGKYVPMALANLLSAADDADLDALGGFAEDLIAKEKVRWEGFGHHHHHHDDEEEE